MTRTVTLKDGPRPSGQTGPHPQPLAEPGEQRREDFMEQEELDAAREWLRHVEAGRIGDTGGD
jgi:hypothetical protein